MNTKAEVRRERDRVWIVGATGWSWRDKPSSVHAAQEAVMRALGERTSYDELLGVSGLAFRMQVSENGLCPSSPHSCCGFRCIARSVEALPWTVRALELKATEKGEVERARRAVVDSVDRGIPVQYGNEEDGIIVGYEKGGEEWSCFHPMRNEGRFPFVETRWPWGIALFTSRKGRLPTRRDLAVESLRQAVIMAVTPKTGTYFVGYEAWRAYIARLRAVEEAEEAARVAAALGNAWIYECLAQYRGSAARYLRDLSREFSPPASDHLLKAARLYERMSGEVLRDEERSAASIAPYPGALRSGTAWSPEMRQEQIKRLEEALTLERDAIGEIELALAAAFTLGSSGTATVARGMQ